MSWILAGRTPLENYDKKGEGTKVYVQIRGSQLKYIQEVRQVTLRMAYILAELWVGLG